MISAVNSIGEQLTIFSFLRIVLLTNPNFRQNNYKNAIVFYDPSFDFMDHLIQIVNSEVSIPTKIRTFQNGSHLLKARQYEQPNDLNIFAVLRASDLYQFKEIQHSLFYSDHRLLLIMSVEETDLQLLESIQRNTLGFRSFLIFRPNCELLVYRVLQSVKLDRYQLDLTSPDTVIEIMHTVYNWRNLDLPYWTPNIFVHYYPPFNMVVPNYNMEGKFSDIELIGTDPLMAYDIAKRLNARGRIVTDLDTVAVGYNWFYGDNAVQSSYADFSHYPKFFDRIVVYRPPVDFNYT